MMQHTLTNLDGTTTNLREQLKANGLLVIYSCNTCPFVKQWENRYNDLYDLCAQHEIGMVLINSNEAKRDGDDSMENMKKKAAEQGYKMPYLLDTDHVVADAFGARTTPHVYLFNQHPYLVYRGAIDDNSEFPDQVKAHYLEDAITAMRSGKEINPNTTKSIGCSIKRVQQ